MGVGSFDNTIAMIAGAGLLLGGAGAACASTISSGPSPFSVDVASPTQTLDFDQFSPSLGTLNQVDISLTGSTIGGGVTAILTGGEGGMASSLFTATLSVLGPGPTTELTGAVSASASCDNPFTFPFSCSSGLVAPTLGAGAFTPNPQTITLALAPFVGLGTVGLSSAIIDYLPITSCSGFGATCNNMADLSWSGSLTVTYDYTPNNPVPEPGTLGLFAAGLVGLGVAGRSRQRR